MIILATKCYVDGSARERALDGLGSLLQNAVGDLDVTYEVGLRDDAFPSVAVEGVDAVAARNLLRDEWGAITPDFESGETYVGTLDGWDENGFVLDAGREVRIPAAEIGLGRGSPEQIRTRFGLVQHHPLEFVWSDSPRLTDEQRNKLYDWTRGTGRVNVNSATRAEVRATVNRAGHAQDIVTVERVGLLEQSVICREGTDPPGLLASIGKHLPSEILAVVT